MAFDIRVVTDEEERSPFVFTANDGNDYELPHIADLTLDQQDRIDRGFLMPVIREVARKEAAAQVAKLKRAQATALLTAWLAHAGQEPGESQASSS